MQTVRHLMAVGVSAAIAFGGSFGNPESSVAQSSLTAASAPADSFLKTPTPKNSQASSPKSEAKLESDTQQSTAATTETDQANPQKTEAKQAATNTAKPKKTAPAKPAQSPRSQLPELQPDRPATPPNNPAATPAPIPEASAEPPVSNPATRVNPLPASQPAPNYVNPSSNPLEFPTQPIDVRIQGTQPITLQQAIELAERNNPELQNARLAVERSQAGLRAAQAANYPNVAGSANLTRQDSNQAGLLREGQENLPPDQRREIDSSPTTSLGGTVGVTYDIFTSGRRAASIKAAERQVRLDELDLEARQEQLRLDVTNDYYDLQQADERVRISQAAVNNAEASLRDAQALERAGVGTRFDVLRSQVQLANAQQDLTQAVSDQRVSRRQLSQRLNIASTIDLAAADPVQIAGLWNLPLEESIVQAVKNRAELEQQLVQREINEQQRRIALAANRPQVSAFANFNLQDEFNDGLTVARSYSAGARLNWTFFDGGEARARARQEEIDQEIAENQFASERNQVRFEVEQSYSSLQANFDNIQTASVALEQARESLRLARLRFQAGVGTQTDVINAETELTRAEANRLSAILDYNRALATLQRSISNLTTTAAPTP